MGRQRLCPLIGQTFQLQNPPPLPGHLGERDAGDVDGDADAASAALLEGEGRPLVADQGDLGLRGGFGGSELQDGNPGPLEEDGVHRVVSRGAAFGCVPVNGIN